MTAPKGALTIEPIAQDWSRPGRQLAEASFTQAFDQNEKLIRALDEARERITALKEEVDKLCAPPSTYGVFLTTDDLLAAVGEKFKENEDLPNTTNPDDWAKIAGRKRDRIVAVRLVRASDHDSPRESERVPAGQYL